MSAAPASSSSPKEDSNGGSSDAASAKSTLSALKQLRAGSTGFVDFYVKVFKQIVGLKAYPGFLDFPMEFILRLVVVIIGSIFLNACPAEPMLPIYLIVNGVVGSSIQILAQIAGSLLKDDNPTWKKVKDSVIIFMFIFLFGWFITGCVWVFRMPLPNMTRYPDSVTPILPGLMNDLLMSYSTSLPTDELASINSTMVALLSTEKHCAFPVYGLSLWMMIFPLVEFSGYFLIITVTAIALYLMPSLEVVNVSNGEKLRMGNV